MLDTPVPLSPPQRDAVAQYAVKEYRRRIRTLTGPKRDTMAKVIRDIKTGNFIERPVPLHDCEQEALIYG